MSSEHKIKEARCSASEHKIHLRTVAELRETFRQRGYTKGAEPLFHCPNEGKHTPSAANRRKALGVSAGVPDLLIVHPIVVDGTTYTGLALELKTLKGTTSAAQVQWLAYWTEAGFFACVTRGMRETAVVLQSVGLIDAVQAGRFR